MLFALLIAAAGAASAASVVFEGAQTEIVVSPRQAVATLYAAKEMKALLGQVLGADIPFVNRPTPGKRGIYVGPGEWSERLGIVTNGLARDEFRIVVRPEGAYIVGRDDPKKNPWMAANGIIWETYFERATLFGVYEFLERYAGVRLYFDGELGTVVPRKDRIVVPHGDFRVAPEWTARRYTGMGDRIWYEGEGRYDPVRTRPPRWRNTYRLRTETYLTPFCHGLVHNGYLQRFGKTHPEYFLLQEDGTRRTRTDIPYPCHLCHTSDIWEEVYRDVRSYFLGEPASVRGVLNPAMGLKVGWPIPAQCGRYYNVMPQDEMPRCACAKCRAAYDDDSNFASTLIWSQTAKVANRLLDEGIGGYVTQMAYPPYLRVPDVEIPTNVLVEVAASGPWTANDPEAFAADVESIAAWSRKMKSKVFVWCYPLKVGPANLPDVPCPAPRAWAKYLKAIAPYVCGIYTESGTDRFMNNHLNYYILSRLSWDTKADADAILDEHYHLMYGPAAAEMQAFMETLEDKWLNGVLLKGASLDKLGPAFRTVSERDLWSRVYDAATIDGLERLIAAAKSRTADGSLERRRVELMGRELFEPLAKKARLFHSRGEGLAKLVYVPKKGERIHLTPFMLANGVLADDPPDTAVDAWREGDAVKVRIGCEEPDMALTAVRDVPNDDPDVWSQDHVELVIDPTGKRDALFHFAVTGNGALADEIFYVFSKDRRTEGAKWNSGATVQVRRNAKAWLAELTIPAAVLEGLSDRSLVEVFRFRSRKGHGYEYYHWSPWTTRILDIYNYGRWAWPVKGE